jgi:hypothetical protein
LSEQWKQEIGALAITLRQVVAVVETTREVGSPCAPSATVGVVEKDVGNWGSVLGAGSVQAAEKSKPKPELKARKKEKPPKVVVTAATEEVERAKVETKVVEEAVVTEKVKVAAVVETTREVGSPRAPSATVGVVEEDVGNWGMLSAWDHILGVARCVQRLV